jgi:2-iminobutanoate/2-iminopropanoate deaminase
MESGNTKGNKEQSNMSTFAEILENIAQLPIQKRAMTNHGVLNEAYAYAKPSSFSRGMRIDLNGLTILLISGTASIDENGVSVHIGDFRAQLRRTFDNITGLLMSEGCTWHDIVRTSCYLRDIDRDYDLFNEERTRFFQEQGLDPLPASTGIQAHLCRPELLIEIEAIAMFRTEKVASSKE